MKKKFYFLTTMARRVSLDNEHMHVMFRKIKRGSYLGGQFHMYVKVYCHESRMRKAP